MSLHNVQYEGVELEFELIRKDVKYINLRVTKRGTVVVSAPEKAPLSVIEDFVTSKALWIITHLAEIEKLRQSAPLPALYSGKALYYLGKPYRLTIKKGSPQIDVTEDSIIMTSLKEDPDALKAEYLSWLKSQAAVVFERVMDRVYPLVEKYGVLRPVIQIRNMRTLWGSCSVGDSRIRLNLQLMKAPEVCIEQVTLHELIHFIHKNHDESFYGLLTELMPDWKKRKKELETKYKDGI